MTRSETMKAIRSTGNKSTEIKFRNALSRAGVKGWSIQPEIEGHPDIAFIPERVAVFLDGCFWHGCEDHFSAPKTRRTQWVKKIRANKERDARTLARFVSEGWKVFRIWEHDLADDATLRGIVFRVARAVDTPDVLEFGRALNMRRDEPERKRSALMRPVSHPLASAGGFHTRWHNLFTEGEN